jgi:hypothetical protein
MKQLFSLTMFCKRVQIPFEVYAFRNTIYNERIVSKSVFVNRSKANIYFDEFRVRNILSSRMNTQTLNKMYEMLWFCASNRGKMDSDPLDSTPLNNTILVAHDIINKFRKDNNLQIVNTIFLTDGGSDSIHLNHNTFSYSYSTKSKGSRYFVRDHITKKNFFVGDNMYGHHVTETFLRMLKDRTGCNLIGFFITNKFNGVATMLKIDYDTKASFAKKFRDDNYVGIVSSGYDEYYIVNIKKASEEISLNVNSDMTKKAVLKEFMKYSNSYNELPLSIKLHNMSENSKNISLMLLDIILHLLYYTPSSIKESYQCLRSLIAASSSMQHVHVLVPILMFCLVNKF